MHCFLLQYTISVLWVFGRSWKNHVQGFFAEVQAGLCVWPPKLRLLRKKGSALTLDRIFQKELQECKRSLHALFRNKSYRPHASLCPAMAFFLSASLLLLFTSVFVPLPRLINSQTFTLSFCLRLSQSNNLSLSAFAETAQVLLN